ncbi:hypothetical protein KSC_093460 [Ktedonobacter sp. SOSP1-52]|nr:hypothetical protein KSC_093460 [Ktedonobacter sp. SOSP1-52]
MTVPPGPRVGRSVVRIDPTDWSLHPLVQGPLARPIDVRFDPSGKSLYILDFGHFEMRAKQGVEALARSGSVFRLTLSRDPL